MDAKQFLDNIKLFYNSKVKATKWAKATDEGQESIFVAFDLNSQYFEQQDCYNCEEKGGSAKSHISPDCPHLCKPHGQLGCGCGSGCDHGCRKGGKDTRSSSDGAAKLQLSQ
eukprot:5128458-Ditylum_brightwellii.AAC.1